MGKILIFGAGGFGREVQWLIERINQKIPSWEIEGYLDDGVEVQTEINGYRVLGGIEKLKEYDFDTAIAVAVGSAKTREKIVEKIKGIGDYRFPNLIDPDVQISDKVSIGEGNIICAGNILTVNITIEDFVIINLSCTVGHDAVLKSFVTVYPGVNISGNVLVKRRTELGTGSKIIQGISVEEDTIVGAGAVVVRPIPCGCVAVGIPAKPAKYPGGGYNRLLIVGSSGHGKVIKDFVSNLSYYQRIQFLDDNPKYQTDDSCIGGSKEVFKHKGEADVIVAIGNADIRRRLLESYEAAGISIVSLIHPKANLPDKMPEIGIGTVVMMGATIQAGTVIGKGVIVNTAASVDHDCRIGDYVHIAVGAHLAGNVEVENGTWIGAGAVVRNNIKICKDVMVGAGAVVVGDITESGTYVGVPARKLVKCQ